MVILIYFAEKVDPWRLVLALRSGQPAESTWALDVLSIMLFDDHTVIWFGLPHLPGLLEILMEHFRRCLIEIFDSEFEDLEIGIEKKKELLSAKHSDHDETEESSVNNEQLNNSDSEENTRTIPGTKVLMPDPKNLDDPKNYTLKTRTGQVVKVEDDSSNHAMMFDNKKWDIYSGFDSGTFEWQLGHGDMTEHVITHFASENTQDFLKSQYFGDLLKHLKSGKPDGDSKIEIKCETEDCKDDINGTLDSSNSDIDCAEQEKENCNPCPADVKKEIDFEMDSCQDKKAPCQENSRCNSVTKKEKLDETLLSNNKDVSNDDEINANEKGENITVKSEPVDDISEETPMDTVRASTPDNNVKKEAGCEKDMLACEKSGWSDSRRFMENLKRRWCTMEEETEAYQRDQGPLFLIEESSEELSRRCVCISNIIRSLSFIPGNEIVLSKHKGLMRALGQLLLLHHRHPHRCQEQSKFDREVDAEVDDVLDEGPREWWWDTLEALRENTLVTIANISGHLNLANHPEEVCFPILDGLLHWAVCPSACAQDPMPTMSSHSVLSAQRLTLEALCKLCVTDSNVDLLLATPPFSRIVTLLSNLVRLVGERQEQVMREFAVVLMSSLVQGDSSTARAVALQHPSISVLLDFIESAEHQAMQVANAHGISMLQENPEMMGTSLDMLRRAATILKHLAEVPENRPLFSKHQQRLLQLVMSQILDQNVASIVSDVLFFISDPVTT